MQPEIAIRGAGPVGCMLALLLKESRDSVVLIQEKKAIPGSLRPIALSHASRLILERAGAWRSLAPVSYTHLTLPTKA